MLKTIFASLAVLCFSTIFAGNRFHSAPTGSDEVVSLPGDSGPVVENQKPGDDELQKCPCDKGKNKG